MTRFQRGDVVFEQAAQPHHFKSVRAQTFLMMVTEGNEKKKPSEERNNNDADSGPREKLEMKMFRAEKPRGGPAKNAATYLWV
jgi:hypothetical protein